MTSLIAAFAAFCLAAGEDKGFLDLEYKDEKGKAYKYVLFVPHDYKAEKEYPLMVFLHGSGESGTDGKKQALTGLGNAIRKQEKSFPFFAIFPQASEQIAVRGKWAFGSPDSERAMAILENTKKAYKIDSKRIYLTGLSMGGYGTWSWAQGKPELWAAIVPICGGGDPASAEKIKNIPCWCFHGDADKAVPVERSRAMMEALKKAGGKPKYDEYPGVGHNSWDKAYGNPELYSWILEQRLK